MVPDDRAVSEVVGFILIFTILVISFTVYQGLMVPGQNREAEFDHNQQAQRQMQDLRNAILTAAGTGTGPSVSIKLGASYPSRTLASNLGVSAGRLETSSSGSGISISNVSALDDETKDYFGQSTSTLGPFDSKSIVYDPTYSFYTNAPETVYENSIVYNRFDNGENLTVTGQTLIDGRRIFLIAVNGSLSESSQGTVSINPESMSTATTTVAVQNATGPITISIPSRLSAANWSTILEEELDPTGSNADRYVRTVKDSGPNQVSIVLEQGAVYDLRVARIGIGNTATDGGPKYLTETQGDNTSVVEGGSQKLAVEVRDRYNNPVSNVTVKTNPGLGTIKPPTQAVSDSQGTVEFVYVAPDDVNGATGDSVDVFFGPPTGAENRTVTFSLDILDTDGSGSGGTGGGGTNAGSGGVSQWSPSNDTQTFAVETGRWTGITRVESIELNNGIMTTNQEIDYVFPGFTTVSDETDELFLDFIISNQTREYRVAVRLEDDSQDGDFNDNGDEKYVRITNTTGSTKAEIFEEELTGTAAEDIIDSSSSSETDILDESSYIGNNYQAVLDLVKLTDADWLTTKMEGQVDVSVEAA